MLAYFLNLPIILLELFINLTPLIPLSFQGEGEEKIKEGLAPLLNTLLS
jgi:hypothetical protein